MSDLARINQCAKRPIDIWTNYLFYPLSIRLVWLVRNWRWVTPNGVTLTSLVLTLVGCGFFSGGSRRDVLWGLLLVEVSYVFDCADGQLARYRQQFSPFGGWLDQIADRIKEFAIYGTLAFGYSRVHGSSIKLWMWTLTALFALYLLEYYGQIHMKKPAPKSTATAPEQAGVPTHSTADADTFAKMQRWRSFVPFRGFIIGEQYFALLVFVLFGAIHPFVMFTAVLGLLMCVYRPAVQLVKMEREQRVY